MFADILTREAWAASHDLTGLRQRFDFAMTKKLGVLSLPPSFWMQDPKINPRADELMLAALLLEDSERLALAFSALAAENQEKAASAGEDDARSLTARLEKISRRCFDLLPEDDHHRRQRIEELLGSLSVTP